MAQSPPSVDKKTAKVLVTGGTGFAGSHLIEALVEAGYHHIHTTAYSDSPNFITKNFPQVTIHRLDLTDRQATQVLFAKLRPDHLYHLASFAAVGTSWQKTESIFTNNINLQLSVLEAVRAESPRSRCLIIGSAEEYGLCQPQDLPISESQPLRPTNPYAVSKVTQSLLAYAYGVSHGLSVINARPFNHIGERQSTSFVVSAFAQQIIDIEAGLQSVIKVGNLEAIRDFTDVKDMVRAYILLMEKGSVGELYNLGSGRGVKIESVLESLIALSTVKIKVERDKDRLRPLDIPKMVADNEKISSLGWKPAISLQQTLERILNWHRSQK